MPIVVFYLRKHCGKHESDGVPACITFDSGFAQTQLSWVISFLTD